ncbi:hypothetical protein CS0771_23960 [Catellatospora sp. IY07-71]|nr:hypothetical protein CS0771_23960 [Catellatospora sp. IY07-71]
MVKIAVSCPKVRSGLRFGHEVPILDRDGAGTGPGRDWSRTGTGPGRDGTGPGLDRGRDGTGLV